MIDVIIQRATSATLTGDARARLGKVQLADRRFSTEGVATFGTFAPTSLVRWISAEVQGIEDQGCSSVKIRIGTDTALYYFDEADSLRIKPVTDESDWTSQYSSPLALASLDLWTEQTLRIVVHLQPTERNRAPYIRAVAVAMDLPVWEGAIAESTRRIVELVAEIRPVLLHTETLTAAKSEWKLGEPHSENGHSLTELVLVTVDGVERPATLTNGAVTLHGPSASVGQVVVVAVKYQPPTAVKRVADVRIINKLPSFLVDDLVRGGGLNGTFPPININGVEVRRRMVELRVQVRGVAARQADALSMRAAMQEKFGGTEVIVLSSGRTVGAAVMEVVEVTSSGTDSMPIAIGTLHCPTTEYTGYTRVSAARRGSAGAYTLPTNTVTISNLDSDEDQVLEASSYESDS